jgi:hypothetical protein
MRFALAGCCLALLLVTSAEAVCPFNIAPPADAPVYTLRAGAAHLTIWRAECVTVLVTPLEPSVEVGALGITQGDAARQTHLVTGYTTVFSAIVPVRLLEPVVAPLATVIDIDLESGPPIDLFGEFALTVNGARRVIPAADDPLAITLVVEGCDPCSTGQTAAFRAHIANPFSALRANLVAGVILPSGDVSAWFSTATTVTPGASAVALPQFMVPAGAPNGLYWVEVALVDPALGTTLARGRARVEKE